MCVMCITPHLMELWATLFAGCGKAALAFPYPVNGVVHDGMGSYAHFHDAGFTVLLLSFYELSVPTYVFSKFSASFICGLIHLFL